MLCEVFDSADGPEAFTMGNPSPIVIYGDDLTIGCNINGNPIPSVAWSHNGVELIENSEISINTNFNDTSGNGVSLLTLMDVDLSDEGTYNCTANSSEGLDSDAITVAVLCKLNWVVL